MRRKRRRRPPIGWRNSVQILCLQEEEDEEEEEEDETDRAEANPLTPSKVSRTEVEKQESDLKEERIYCTLIIIFFSL